MRVQPGCAKVSIGLIMEIPSIDMELNNMNNKFDNMNKGGKPNQGHGQNPNQLPKDKQQGNNPQQRPGNLDRNNQNQNKNPNDRQNQKWSDK